MRGGGGTGEECFGGEGGVKIVFTLKLKHQSALKAALADLTGHAGIIQRAVKGNAV